MEDVYVLAEVLRSAASVETALAAYVSRRTPRVQWVWQESRAVAERFGLPLATRNAALRTRGDQMMQERYRPLIPAP